MPRRTNDVRYFTDDRALELDGLREGGPGWWLRGHGDATNARDVSHVLQSTERSSVLGYDIIVAAPRPTSVLVAIDPEHAPAIVAAHRISVAGAIEYLEEHALVVRDRRAGEDRDRSGRWSGAVGFTHGLNRHGEPHLHDHVLVGARPSDASTVLDSRALFAHIVAADALYRSSLRYEVRERTPWEAWRSFAGVEHVAGLDEGYRVLWGGHHSDRGEKLHWQRDEVLARWSEDRARFDEHGVVVPPTRHRGALDEHAFAGALEGRSDVARRHVVAAWANAARFGQSAQSLSQTIDALYPELAGARGVREPSISVREARMTNRVRERGARPLEIGDLERWRQRSRDEPRSRSDRSR